MSERAVPFYCPYCGDEDLSPSQVPPTGPSGAVWECAACSRAFQLAFVGLLAERLGHVHRETDTA